MFFFSNIMKLLIPHDSLYISCFILTFNTSNQDETREKHEKPKDSIKGYDMRWVFYNASLNPCFLWMIPSCNALLMICDPFAIIKQVENAWENDLSIPWELLPLKNPSTQNNKMKKSQNSCNIKPTTKTTRPGRAILKFARPGRANFCLKIFFAFWFFNFWYFAWVFKIFDLAI